MSNASKSQTVIGPDCVIDGQIELDSDLVIQGRINGMVRVAGVLDIAASGEVTGTIVAGTVRLAGKVTATLIAEQGLTLGESAALSGRLFTTRLSITDGAMFDGDINVGPQAMAAAQELLERIEGGEDPMERALDPDVTMDSSVIGRILDQRRAKTLSTASVLDQAVTKSENKAG